MLEYVCLLNFIIHSRIQPILIYWGMSPTLLKTTTFDDKKSFFFWVDEIVFKIKKINVSGL
jgi:hypothetical protein